MTLKKEYRTDIICVSDGVELIGDEETYFSIVSDYLFHTGVLLKDIDQALDATDFEMIQFKAHNLKGASGNLSIHRMSNVGAELENAIRDKRHSEIPMLVAEAHREFASLKQHLLKKKYPVEMK